MLQYQNAVRTVLNRGTRKENRTGVDTISTFGVPYQVDLREGFPLLTTKKISWKNIVVENLWFLSGEKHIGILRKHGCKFWDAWADPDGFVPSAYGNFWRRFPVHDAEDGTHTEFYPDVGSFGDEPAMGLNDQVEWAIAELKRNPMSRRIVISSWAPGNAQTSDLPPCHIVHVLNVQNLRTVYPDGTWEDKPHLCMHLTQRSCDIALGVPYNLAGYAFLLELYSRFSGIPAGIFSHMLVDAHAYTCKPDGSMADMDHVPGLEEQLTRKPRPLPKLVIDPTIQNLEDINQVMECDTEDLLGLFQLEGYDPHPAIKFKVAV